MPLSCPVTFLFSKIDHLLLILICISTGFLEQGVLVRDLDRLVKTQTSQVKFYLTDLLAILPTDLLYFLIGHYEIWPIVRLNRLLKLNRLLEFRSQTETSTNYPYFFRILSIYTFIVLIIHWNACIFNLLRKYFDAFQDKDDIFTLIASLNESDTVNGHLLASQYVKCFYRSTLQLTTISNIDPPRTSFEKIYMIISFLAGVLVFALIVGSVAEIIDDLNSKRREFQKKVDGVKIYMQLANVNDELQVRTSL